MSSNQTSMSIAQYLTYVYPLAASAIAGHSEEQLQTFFNQLTFYYKLNPQPSAVIPAGNYVARNTEQQPEIGDLYSPSIINPDGFVCRNIYPSANPLNNSLANGFPSHVDIEICHSNVYDGSLGIYYYHAPGSGIFVNLGKTLVANNKLDALKKLGYSNREIADALYTPGTAYWPAYYQGQLPPANSQQYFITLVKKFMQEHSCSQTVAENVLIEAAINETNYLYGRVNDTGWQVDVDNFNLAKAQGYDTVQLTTQANMNNGWAFEIIDLRVSLGASLEQTMNNLTQYYSIINPYDKTQKKAIKNQWPYYNLYAEQTMSSIAKYYPAYESRFSFPGPGYIPTSNIPGYPE